MDESRARSSARIDDVVTAVCRLPVDFYAAGNVSPVELVRRSGYLAVRAEITAKRLMSCLGMHADWVDAWFDYADAQRCVPCWFVVESAPGVYEIGLQGGKEPHPRTKFDDRLEACAEYVHIEVESIAGHPVLAAWSLLLRARAIMQRKTVDS